MAATAIELAAIYHHARDVHPHNPVHRVRFLDGGALFFRPDPQAFAGQRIQPHLAGLLDDVDPLQTLLPVARARDLAVRAWTITLHNYTLGERYPDATAENAFGDRLLTDLCPANPDARAYVRTVTAELARTGVDSITAESICYMPFDHGFHHERTPYPLSETARYCLSLCFCQHCRARACTAGVDVDGLREVVRVEVDRALRRQTPSLLDDLPLEREAVATIAGGEMGGLLDVREEIVTSLVAEITDAVEAAGPARFVFMDSHGADEGADQTGSFIADRSWRFGIDLPAVARNCHGLAVIGYSRDDARFRADLDRYREILPRHPALTHHARPAARVLWPGRPAPEAARRRASRHRLGRVLRLRPHASRRASTGCARRGRDGREYPSSPAPTAPMAPSAGRVSLPSAHGRRRVWRGARLPCTPLYRSDRSGSRGVGLSGQLRATYKTCPVGRSTTSATLTLAGCSRT